MSFLKRLKYYLIGIGLGTFVVLIFFGPRAFQCSYFPNSRTLEEAKFRGLNYSPEAETFLETHGLDTVWVKNQLFKKSKITNFGSAEVKTKPCRTYRADYQNDLSGLNLDFVFKICKDSAYLEKIKLK